MNFFDIIKAVYQKTILPDFNYDTQLCITISKWIGFDVSNIEKIKNVLSYLFYIEPQHYIYLLYVILPQKTVPYFNNPVVKKEKENKLYKCIQDYFQWSNHDLQCYLPILDKVIDSKRWSKEFGIC